MNQTNQAAIEASDPLPVIAIPLLSLAAFAASASARVTDTQLPQLALEFNISLGQASATVTSFAIAYGVAQLLFGPLGDRYGKYLVVALVCIASAMAALLCGFATSFPMLVASRLVAGVAAAAIIPLSMAWIGDVIPYQVRQPIIARFLIGQILGLSTGMFVGGLAADALGWRMPFFGIAAIFLVAGLALLHYNRSLPAHARVTHRAEGAALRRVVNEFRQVWAKPWARFVLLCVFIEAAAVFGAIAFVASHLYRSFGVSLTAAGSLVMFFGLGGILFALASKALLQRFGEVGVARLGGALAAIFLLVIALSPTWWWAAPACFVVGLGYYMLHNTLQTNATQMAPERRGAAVSAFASSFYFGQSAGVGLAGMMVETTGTTFILVAGGIGVLLAGWAFSARRRTRPVA